jgi:transcriptional regulator with XRE-family HTH domain
MNSIHDPVLDPEALLAISRRRKITQQSLISELGISSKTYGTWMSEEAQPRPTALRLMARILRCEESDLQKEREGDDQ